MKNIETYNLNNLIFLTLLLLSCNGPNQKYALKAKDVDGDPCKNYIVSDYENFEIARCVEKQVYFISPIGDFRKYEDRFYQNAALIYIRDTSNFEILKNEKFMIKIFEGLNPNWKIMQIQLNDSRMEIDFFNDSIRPIDYFTKSYKIK
jgi:hypothetical protein